MDLTLSELRDLEKQVDEHMKAAMSHTIGELPTKSQLEAVVSNAVGMIVKFPDYSEATGEATRAEVFLPMPIKYIDITLEV